MKIFLKSILYLILFIIGCSLLISFLQWTESDKYEETKSKIQLLPFELVYEYQGKDTGYQNATSRYVRLFIENEQQELEQCSEDLVSLENYEHLIKVVNKVPPSEHAYIIARVYELKPFGVDCDVEVADWDKFTKMKRLSKTQVEKFNRNQNLKKQIAKFNKLVENQ